MQPHAGAQANAAVYHALLEPGDTIMGLALPHGGHLTHGMKINVSGKLYDIAPYEVDRETRRIDMDEVERIAHERRPKLILAGWSAYPRFLDFERFRAIADEVGALLMVDMAHFAGLVAAGHPSRTRCRSPTWSPRPCTRRSAARAAARSCARRSTPRRSTRPSSRASRAGRWSTSSPARRWRSRSPRPRRSASASGAPWTARRRWRPSCSDAGHGVSVLTGGTDVHLVLVDLRESELDGQQAEDRLHEIGITVNRNAVPFDPRPPMVTSGLRVGTAALATAACRRTTSPTIGADHRAALQPGFEEVRDELAERVTGDRRPLPAVREPGRRRSGLALALVGEDLQRRSRSSARR